MCNIFRIYYILTFSFYLLKGLLSAEEYQGLYLGKFNTYSHQVTGEVYAVDEYTFLVKDFVYDGIGQDTFFWAGSTVRPSNVGFIVPDEEGKTNKLQRYVNKHLTLRLPDKKKITSVRWLAVWDLREHSNYADVYIPEGFEPPSPQRISELSRLSHGVQSDSVIIKDSKTIIIPQLYYTGNSTDVYFWVGLGPQPNSYGQKISDENGYLSPLSSYDGEDATLELPGDMTVFDVDWLSIWNEKDQENYGSVIIPDGLNIPPSLLVVIKRESRLPNCEQLHKNLLVHWEIFGPQITFELAGQIDEDDYMALGISGSTNSSQMLNADVAISYMDGLLGTTTDYNITDRYPCSNVLGLNKGVCPDLKVGGVDNYQIHTYIRENGITTITYRRNLINTGDEGDKLYNQEGDTYFVWAIGKYNKFKEPGFHHTYPRGNIKFNLGRKPAEKHCYGFTRPLYKEKRETWPKLSIKDRAIKTFIVRVGQPGSWKGYQGITGTAHPGIVWYVNGLLAPELYVKRGKKYIFKVEGGSNPYNAIFYHPFYITDDPIGGYAKYTEEEREKVKVYAGIEFDRRGRPHPTAAGRLCAWIHDKSETRKADNYPNFPKFRNSLKLKCDDGEPAILEWIPNSTIPETLYYQSYTQRNMGAKIHVLDEIIISGKSSTSPFLLLIVMVTLLICLKQ